MLYAVVLPDGSLLLAAYRNGRLRYFGYSGTRFSEKGLKEAMNRLKPHFVDESPVENPPKSRREFSGFSQSLCAK
jgi:bifunctional non-homologous end joining protein LigD